MTLPVESEIGMLIPFMDGPVGYHTWRLLGLSRRCETAVAPSGAFSARGTS